MLKATLALALGTVAQASYINYAPALLANDDYWKGVILGMQDNPALTTTDCYSSIDKFLTDKNEATGYTISALNLAMSAQGLSTNNFSYYISYAKRLQETVNGFFSFYQ
jgi:hypothetical protein